MVFQEPEIIAKVSRSPTELSEEQLIQFGELAVLVRSANESSRAEAFVRILNKKLIDNELMKVALANLVLTGNRWHFWKSRT